jgi:hypothetical protein
MLDRVRAVAGARIGSHQVHLYNAIYRFDDHMIVTPYLSGRGVSSTRRSICDG